MCAGTGPIERRGAIAAAAALGLALSAARGFAQGDPLPSWTDGAAKLAILDFVTRVTTKAFRRRKTPQCQIGVLRG